MNLGEFLLLITGINILTLGNGPVMVPLLRRSFVEEHRGLSAEQLLYAYGIAQAAPGQANLCVASIGYMLLGPGAALLAVLAINLPGYSMLLLVRGYDRLRNLVGVRRFISGLTSTSVGLIFASTLTRPSSWVVFLLVLALNQYLRWNSLLSVLVAGAVGLALVFVV
jgi:chromate transporter